MRSAAIAAAFTGVSKPLFHNLDTLRSANPTGLIITRYSRSPHSSSSSSPSKKPPLYSRSSACATTSSSLYGRPSLREMESDRAVNRSRVYDFLRSIGVVPDELDGLELPVTTAVMRDRVDFLHSLGLTIADINSYPLVLGCSVKKNMIPVLDFLGNLGIRRAAVPDLLRRYPQVLHASVAVDLEPVVKYLLGLDIKPSDLPGLLERYPDLLGFKLEGTMSTSVAYLVGIGVARRSIGAILTQFPEILGMRVGRTIKPFVEHLEGIGLRRLAVARLIEKTPFILGFDLDSQVKPNLDTLVEMSLRKEALPAVVAQYPEILGTSELHQKLAKLAALLESELMINGSEELARMIERMPQIAGLSDCTIVNHIEFLRRSGFASSQVRKMVVACPQLLALNMDMMEMSLEFFKKEMERGMEDLVEFPSFFTYGLESTIKPRHETVAGKGLKCSLAWMLQCSDAKFQERMSYESIGIEEMEAEPVSIIEAEVEEEEEEEEDFHYVGN